MKTNWTKFLCRAESHRTQKQFFSFLALQQSICLDNMSYSIRRLWGEDTPDGEDTAVVLGGHAAGRMLLRLGLFPEDLTELIDRHLRSEEVVREIRGHRVCLDDDENIVGFDDTTKATIVATEGSNALIVYEAGFSYIRLKTVWNVDRRPHFDQYSAVVKLMKDGAVVRDRKQISEVA